MNACDNQYEALLLAQAFFSYLNHIKQHYTVGV